MSCPMEVETLVIEGPFNIVTVADGRVTIPEGYSAVVEWGVRGRFERVIQLAPRGPLAGSVQ